MLSRQHDCRVNGTGSRPGPAALYLTALLCAILLLTAGKLQASDNRDWYDVEIVVFRQFDGGNVQSAERWPTNPDPARFERYARVSTSASGQRGAADSDTNFLRLGDNALRLRDTASRMRSSGAYQILLHTAWRQPGMPNNSARAVYLPLDQAPPGPAGEDARVPAGLSGHIRLVREQFLHFDVDLRFAEPGTERVVVMQERRRMRSGELHYFDNPRLGVLVIATPLSRD